MPSSVVLKGRQPDRHIFDDVIKNWKEMPPDPKSVLPGYIQYEEFIKSLKPNFSEHKVYYTGAYAGTNVERGFGIRIVARTKAGQEIETFYEFSTSAKSGTRWKIMSESTGGLYTIKNGNLIGKIGENKLWQLLEKERKITLSLPTSGQKVAKTVELRLHKDARLLRLEYKGNGNGLDIVTKAVPPNPPPEWVWLIIELKTSAVHGLDVGSFSSVNRGMTKVQKGGVKYVEKHVKDALHSYQSGNPYNLSAEDFRDINKLWKAIDSAKRQERTSNIAGLFITQGLDETFDYAINTKHQNGMRIVKEWFNSEVVLK